MCKFFFSGGGFKFRLKCTSLGNCSLNLHKKGRIQTHTKTYLGKSYVSFSKFTTLAAVSLFQGFSLSTLRAVVRNLKLTNYKKETERELVLYLYKLTFLSLSKLTKSFALLLTLIDVYQENM